MPIIKQFDHPYQIGTFNGYCWVAEANFAFSTKSGRVVYFVHADEASANAGKPPLVTVAFDITPTGKSAVYGPPPQLTPYKPAVYGDPPLISPAQPEEKDADGNVTQLYVPAVYGDAPLISPEELATYGDAPLIHPAFPSFDDLITQNIQAYQALAVALYTLALGQPEFAGGELTA